MIENGLLAGLQETVLQPDVVHYALERFQAELGRELRKVSGQADEVRRRKALLEAEISNLAQAIAQGYSPTLTAGNCLTHWVAA